MKQRLLSVLLVITILLPLTVGLSGCGKSGFGSTAVSVDKGAEIGNLKKNGWMLSIPKGSFDGDATVSVTEVAKNGEAFTAGKDAFLIKPIEISVEGTEHVRLNQPVTITMKLDKNKLPDAENFDRYVMAYWTGEEWEPIIPDPIRLSEGYLEFETWHFSSYGGKLMTREEQIKLYARRMALEQWSNDSTEPTMREKLETVCNDYLDGINLYDPDVRNDIKNYVKNSGELGILYALANAGDAAEVALKCTEIVVQATVDVCAENPLALEALTTATGMLGEYTRGMLALEDGDYRTAASELTSLGATILGYGSISTAKSVVELTAAAVELGVMGWKDYELECAYKAYRGLVSENAYGYKLNPGDWETLMIQMRGYYNQLVRERKDAYMKISGKTSLTSAEHAMLEGQVESDLRKKFEARAAQDKLIDEKQAEFEKIIQGFKDNGLLTRLETGFKYEMTIEERLRSLFSIRQNILNIVGGDISVFGNEKERESNLNLAIMYWITYGKDRGKFYDWMRERGYLKKKQETAGYWKRGEVYISKFEESLDDGYYVESWSGGNGTYAYWCQTTFDYSYIGSTHKNCRGEYVANTGKSSTPKDRYLGGEQVALDLSIAATTSQHICFHLGASLSAAITTINKDDPFVNYGTDTTLYDVTEKHNKSYIWTDKNDTNTGYTGMAVTVGGIMPAGYAEGDKIYIIVGFSGGNQIVSTAYEYIWHTN